MIWRHDWIIVCISTMNGHDMFGGDHLAHVLIPHYMVFGVSIGSINALIDGT